MAELADAPDSKSGGKPCGFESHHQHQTKNGIVRYHFFVRHVGLEKEGAQFCGLPQARHEIRAKTVQWTVFLTRPEGESHHQHQTKNGIVRYHFFVRHVGLEKEGAQFCGLPQARHEIRAKTVQWTVFLTRPEGESHHQHQKNKSYEDMVYFLCI